jgi:hypothetical protein
VTGREWLHRGGVLNLDDLTDPDHPASGVVGPPIRTTGFVLSGTGGGSDVTTGIGGSGATVRQTIRIPVTTKRWRRHISNSNTRSGAPTGGAFTFTGLWVGPVAKVTTGWNGAFAATPIKALDAWTSPDLSAEYVSPWVTAPAAQIPAYDTWQVSLGYTGTNATAIKI